MLQLRSNNSYTKQRTHTTMPARIFGSLILTLLLHIALGANARGQ